MPPSVSFGSMEGLEDWLLARCFLLKFKPKLYGLSGVILSMGVFLFTLVTIFTIPVFEGNLKDTGIFFFYILYCTFCTF